MSRRESLGPATREPGDQVRAEAIELLACCSSQPGAWTWETQSIPGAWSQAARFRAQGALPVISPVLGVDTWREMYAEAEARLREQVEMEFGRCPSPSHQVNAP